MTVLIEMMSHSLHMVAWRRDGPLTLADDDSWWCVLLVQINWNENECARAK